MDNVQVHFLSKIGMEVRSPHKRIKALEISEYVCLKDFDEIREGESVWAGWHPDKCAMFISEDGFGERIPIGHELFYEHFEQDYALPVEIVLHSSYALDYEIKRMKSKIWFSDRIKNKKI